MLVEAKIADFRFHDLRHEATTQLFERGLTTMEVQKITGHKTLAMLLRYTQMNVDHVVKRLDATENTDRAQQRVGSYKHQEKRAYETRRGYGSARPKRDSVPASRLNRSKACANGFARVWRPGHGSGHSRCYIIPIY
jgi:hypothetical protein